MPAEVPAGTTLELDVTVDAPGACESRATTAIRRRAGVDEVAASSDADDVETETSAWKPTHTQGSAVWARAEVSGDQHEWRGPDPVSTSDLALESPDLHVSASEPFVVEFEQRHAFEVTPAMDHVHAAYWDGGVIELSDDAGHTWKDVSSFVAPGYGGTIDATGSNPLGGRPAFVGVSDGYPEMTHVRLDLGTQLAGKTVRLRFRIGSDEVEGGEGWAIDSLVFGGIEGTPFASLEADPVCALEPPAGDGDGGCGCRVGGGGGRPTGRGAALVLVVLGAAFARRRRYLARTSRSASVSAARAGATAAGAAAKPSFLTRISYFLPASTLRKRY
jgi:MYXO-CTERM domain-containing protein